MTPRELYAAEKARYHAKQETIFAPIRVQLADIVDAHPQSANARASAKRFKGLDVKARDAAYYQANKARIRANQRARRSGVRALQSTQPREDAPD